MVDPRGPMILPTLRSSIATDAMFYNEIDTKIYEILYFGGDLSQIHRNALALTLTVDVQGIYR